MRNAWARWSVFLSVWINCVCQAAVFYPEDVPGVPNQVFVYAENASALRVQVFPPSGVVPLGSNGDPVLGYQIDVAKRVYDVQTFTIQSTTGPITTGAYRISYTNAFGTASTIDCVPWNATDVQFAAALQSLPNIDAVNVSRSLFGAVPQGYVYMITFTGANLVNGPQNNVLTASVSTCTPFLPATSTVTLTGSHTSSGTLGFVPEVWQLMTAESTLALGITGTLVFSIGFQGNWVALGPTVNIDAGSRTIVTTAANSLVGLVSRGDVIQVGGQRFRIHATAPFTDLQVPLDSKHITGAQNVPVYVYDTALGRISVTQGSASVATSSDFTSILAVGDDIQISGQEFTVNAITSSTITLGSISNDLVTAPWPLATSNQATLMQRKKVTVRADAQPAEMAALLQTLPGIGTVKVSRMGPTQQLGYVWSITLASLGPTSCPTSPCLRVDPYLLNEYGAACATCSATLSQLTNNVGVLPDFGAPSIISSTQIGNFVYEVQSILTSASSNSIGGYFYVNFGSYYQATPSLGALIKYNDLASDVKSKLQSLPTIGTVNVTRTAVNFGYQWLVTFTSNMGNQPLMTISSNSLTGSNVQVTITEVTRGVSSAFEAVVGGLPPKTPLAVRALAVNRLGTSPGSNLLQQYGQGANLLQTLVQQPPGAPSINAILPVSFSQLGLTFTPPTNDGSSPIQSYLIETTSDASFGTPLVVALDITNGVGYDTQGTFQLKYGSITTQLLSVDASAATLAGALNRLPNLRPVTASRYLVVMTGANLNAVTSYSSTLRTLALGAGLTALQASMLTTGSVVVVNQYSFTITTAPTAGDMTIAVSPTIAGTASFANNYALFLSNVPDTTLGPFGYRWLITFGQAVYSDNKINSIDLTAPQGLQFVSNLISTATGNSIPGAINRLTPSTFPSHYNAITMSTAPHCNTFTVGPSSRTQILQIFASTTITAGSYQLQLDGQSTSCIAYNAVATGTASSMKALLEALPNVGKVMVTAKNNYKQVILPGTQVSQVTAYSSSLNVLTVISTGLPGLTAAQASSLALGAIIRVQKNPWATTQDVCTFTVATAAALHDTTIAVTPLSSTCSSFAGETRSLMLLDMPTYKITFYGDYPTGEWPILRVVNFGVAPCAAWVPAVQVKSRVDTLKYEGPCVSGSPMIQTLIADASTALGGTFTLSYAGQVSPPLSVTTTTATAVASALQAMVSPASANSISVSTMRFNTFGRAWQVTFAPTMTDPIDVIVINDGFLTGTDAVMQSFPVIEFISTSQLNSLRGDFTIAIDDAETGPIGVAATLNKVVSVLQDLYNINVVMALSNYPSDSNQIGYTSLALTVTATAGSNVLTNVLYMNAAIDPSIYIATGDIIQWGAESHVVASVSAGDIVLSDNAVTGGATIAASVGTLLRSTKQADGYVSTYSTIISLVTATVGSNTIVLSASNGVVNGDVLTIGSTYYTVQGVNGDGVTVTLTSNYAGTAVATSQPATTVYRNWLITSEDLTASILNGDHFWYTWNDGTWSEFIAISVSNNLIQFSGTLKAPIVQGTIKIGAGGYRYPIVFKSYQANLNSIDAIPGNSWKGLNARLRTIRPFYVQPYSVTLGNPSMVQTITLSAATSTSAGTGATYTLSFLGETTAPIQWTDTTTAIASALSALTVVDGVTVQSTAVGFGYVHTITFWGDKYNIRILPALTTTFTLGAGGTLSQVSITQYTLKLGSPYTMTGPWYNSYNAAATYAVRISAVNAAGIGPSSDVVLASTAMTAVLPSPPVGVTFDYPRGATWLELKYKKPFYDGGAPITMYQIQWDSSPNFDGSGPGTGYKVIRQIYEVQSITLNFRSPTGRGGTFTLAFGGQVSTPLSYSCTSAQLAAALIVITGNINVQGSPIQVTQTTVGWGTTWTVTFVNNLGDLAPLRADTSMLQGDFPTIIIEEVQKGEKDIASGDFTYEVQDIYTTAVSPLTGTFVLSFDGVWTAPISVSATALQVQGALQAISSIYTAKVSKVILNSALNTACWSVTFAHIRNNVVSGSGNIFPMIVVSSSLSGTQANVAVAEKVKGTNPFTLRAKGLTPGRTYYARVMAYNNQGFGSNSGPFAQGIPRSQPGPPVNVSTTINSATALAVAWGPPINNSGAAVDQYRVEWFRTSGQPSIQAVTTSSLQGLPEIQQVTSFATTPSLTGYFKLSFLGQTSGNIAWNAPATGPNSVQSLLELVPGVGSVSVTVAPSLQSVPGLYVILTTTTTAVAQLPITDVTSCCGFSVNDALTIAGQSYTIATLAGTTITLNIVGQAVTTTVPVPVFRSANGYQWTITFGDMNIGDVPELVVTPSDNWSGTSAGIYVSTLRNGVAPIGGTFRLTVPSNVNGLVISEQTPPIPFNASASLMQLHLESLSSVSSIAVSRSTNGYGFSWFITFLSEIAGEVMLIQPDGSGLTGASVSISASITTPGVQPSYFCESAGAPGACQVVSASLPSSTVLPQLATGIPYMTLVRAHNSEGWGPGAWGSPQYETPRAPPPPPTNVLLMSLSSTMLKIIWSPPANSGGAVITSYLIQWDTNSGFANVASPTFDYFKSFLVQPTDTGPFFYNIPVTSGVLFYVRIAAINDQGSSLWAKSVPTSIQAQNVRPGPPIAPKLVVLSSTGYLVTWQSPSINYPAFGGTGGLPITQYMVEWDQSPAFDSPAAFTMVSPSALSYIIGGRNVVTGVISNALVAGGTYFVRVTAFNGLGASATAPTAPTSATLANQLPSTPGNLQLTDLSATSVLASWQTPIYDGGLPLQTYTLQYDVNSSYMSGAAQSVNIPIVHERQNALISTDPVSEIQYVEATVQVTNERQTVRTTVNGVDEIQTITTSSNNVIDEIQTITTSATDRNEVQAIVLDGTYINEIQGVRTTVTDSPEVQTVVVGTTRVNEIQSLTIVFSGISTTAGITGTLVFGLDTTYCSFCKYQLQAPAVDVTTAVTSSTDAAGGSAMVSALQGLSNVQDTVDVTRTTTTDAVNNLLTMVFSITFSGVNVAGNVPAITVQSSSLGPLQNNFQVPTTTTEVQVGSNPIYAASSVFRLLYTCEQYSDPSVTSGAFPGISTACQPTGAPICASCATGFNGVTMSVSVDLTGLVQVGAVLQVGPCVFSILSLTTSALTIDTTNVGQYCSTFSGQVLPIYTATVLPPITNLVMRQGAAGNQYPELGSSVGAQFFNVLNKAVSVVATPVITLAFVGTSYAISFISNTGTIPLMTCDISNMQFTSGTRQCTVTRTSTGSMIYGSFTLSLARASDGSIQTTAAIPFDATPATMTSALQAVGAGGELVWGSVSVTRTMYLGSATRWSGGYAWKIQFLTRGGNVPTMTFTSSLSNAKGATPAPVIVIEDALNLLTPPIGSVDGNQLSGSFKLSYNGVVSQAACILGTNTDGGNILTGPTIEDIALETFLKNQFGWSTVSVFRTLPTKAYGFTWYITYTDQNTGGNIPLIQIASPSLSGAGATITTQEIVPGNQLGGTFQLQYNGQTTGPISFSASVQEVATQLNNLNSIQPSQVVVSRVGPFGPTSGVPNAATQVGGYQWSITFFSSTWKDPTSDHSVMTAGNWIGPPASWSDVWETGYSKAWGRQVGPLTAMGLQLVCLPQALTVTANDGSQTCTVATTRPGVGPLKGTFTLQLDSTLSPYMSRQVVAVSAPIQHNAWASAVQSQSNGQSMQEILQSMTNIGTVSVTRSSVNVLTGGYTWTVTFLYDKEPCAEHDSIYNLCNSPGNVPMLTVGTNSLGAPNAAISVCDQTSNPCGVAVDGVILRSSFNVFKVTGDPGVEGRFSLAMTCQGATAGSTCALIVGGFVLTTAQPNLPATLLAGDQFYLSGYTSCIFTVVSTTSTFIDVVDLACASMVNGLTGGPFQLTMVLPWNAQVNAINRVLRAASSSSLETGIWSNGRVTSVTRTVIGQYGAMSWLIRFISNPGNTPPGAGNIAPLTVAFQVPPTCTCQVTVTETQAGSIPLGGTFTIDYHSANGPRTISFMETKDRLERKLNEMNTLSAVRVTLYQLPSTTTGCTSAACSGGWEDQPVLNDGTRGGYRWGIVFLKNPGEYYGYTYPPGTGNMNPLTVSYPLLTGTQSAVNVFTIQNGNSPLSGAFRLTYNGSATPSIPFSASGAILEQAIESLPMMSIVPTTADSLSLYAIPNALATIAQDGSVATISGVDITQYFAPGDIIRFGPPTTNMLQGSNGDIPVTGTLSTSLATVDSLSPVITFASSMTTVVYPGNQLRLGGSIYTVARTGIEVQTLTVAMPTASWTNTNLNTAFYTLTLSFQGLSATSACIPAQVPNLATTLNGLLSTIDISRSINTISVTQSQATAVGGNTQYVYTIYFGGSTVLGNVAQLTTGACGTTPTGATATLATLINGGRTAHQRLMLSTDSGTVLDPTGSYQLTLGSTASPCLKWGDTSSSIQTQLSAAWGDTVLVSRHGNGQSTTEVQSIVLASNSAVINGPNGYFRLSFTNGGTTATTGCLNYGLSATDLQTALNGLSNVMSGHIVVSRTGDGTAMSGYGYQYTVSFSGNLNVGTSNVLGDVASLVVFSAGTGLCSPVVSGLPSIQVKTIQPGVPSYTYNLYFVGNTFAQVAPISIAACGSGSTIIGGSSRRLEMAVRNNGGSYAIQKIIVKDPTQVIAGTPSFKLSFLGQTTTNCINYNALNTDVQTALFGLSTIGNNAVVVSRDIDPINAPNGFVFLVTFTGASLGGTLPLLSVVNTGCTAFAATSSVVISSVYAGGGADNKITLTSQYTGDILPTVPAYSVSQSFTVLNELFAVYQIVISNPNNDITAGGTYDLTLNSNTATVGWKATEVQMEAIFLSLTGVASGITVTLLADPIAAPNRYTYKVYCLGALAMGSFGSLTYGNKQNFGTGTIAVSTIRSGSNTNIFGPTTVPLGTLASSATPATYIGPAGTNLQVYKTNGFLWSMYFSQMIGDVAPLVPVTTNLNSGAQLSVVDNFVQGSPSSNYTTTNLLPGVQYYMKVSTSTSMGSSPWSASSVVIPSAVPPPPVNLQAGNDIYVPEVQRVKTAARHILEVQSVSTSASVIAEVQTLTVTANPCGSNNCIQGNIAFRLPTVQVISITANAAITAGQFQLVYIDTISDTHGTLSNPPYYTSAINWNAQASTVAAALVNSGGLLASDIVVTRDGDASASFGFGYVFSVTFVSSTVAGQVMPMQILDSTASTVTCTAFSVAGNAPYSLAVTQSVQYAMGTNTAVQRVIMQSPSVLYTGGYTLSFNFAGATATTTCIPFNADAPSVKAALELLSNIDLVYVVQSTDPVLAPNGFIYDIFFYGQGVTRYTVPALVVSTATCTPFKTLVNNVLTNVAGATATLTYTHPNDNTNGFYSAQSGTATQLQTDLARLPILTPNVFVSSSLPDSQGGTQWTIVFDQASGDLEQFVCSSDATFKAVAGAKCTVATLIDGNVLSGSFLLGASDPIPYNANPATMKAILEQMSWVGSVYVTQSPPNGQRGYNWTITFLTYQGAAPLLTPTNLLQGIGNNIVVTEVTKGNQISGTFQLFYRNATTTPIAYNAPASFVGDGSSMQEKLQALPTIGALQVSRTGPDYEGGYEWFVTFRDDILTPGDIVNLKVVSPMLNAQNATVDVKEIVKGSTGSGARLWVSFDPPMTDNGDPISQYTVKWDTSNTFSAAPGQLSITDPSFLYSRQYVTTSSPSLSWSGSLVPPTYTIQSITIGAVCPTFTLTFQGQTATINVDGITTLANVQSLLSAIVPGGVTVTPSTGFLALSTSFVVTFSGRYGPQPILTSSAACAVPAIVQTGTTNFLKEILAFTCSGTAGTVTITANQLSKTFPFNALLSEAAAGLTTLLNSPTGGITVSAPSQLSLCVASSPQIITITFHYVYGNLQSSASGAGGTTVTPSASSVSGIYNYPITAMSGTFQLSFAGALTPPLNAQSSAMDVRVALESLPAIQIAAVTQAYSAAAIIGTVDVQQGQLYVTCSSGQVCNFAAFQYGMPKSPIRIGGTWYTVLSDTISLSMPSTALYLGDMNYNPIAYQGASATGVLVYQWNKGYEYAVDLLLTTAPSLSMIRANNVQLSPSDAGVITTGASCQRCVYIGGLYTGNTFFVGANAYNSNGASLTSSLITAIPKQVPDAPNTINVVIISGSQVLVFFSPPTISTLTTLASYNNDISSYIIQWDTSTSFKHGLPACVGCATTFSNNILTVNKDLTSLLIAGNQITIGSMQCVLTITAISPSSITTAPSACLPFLSQAFNVVYYTIPPVTVSGIAIQGTPPYQYLIQGLTPQTTYYIRIAAVNSVPFQQISASGNPPNNCKWTFPAAVTPTNVLPDPILSAQLYVQSATSLELRIQPSTRDGQGLGGSAITFYSIDVDTVSTFSTPGRQYPIDVPIANFLLLYAGGPLVYYINNLVTGTPYFVQVRAKTSVGYSLFKLASNSLAPSGPPGVPSSIRTSTSVSQLSAPITQATITWAPPTLTGGLAVQYYQVEWWTTAPRAEVQVVQLQWTTAPTALTFTLAFGGSLTGSIPMNCAPENVRNALMNIGSTNTPAAPMIGNIEVTRTAINTNQGYQWSITFVSALRNQPMLQLAIVSSTGGAGIQSSVFEAVAGVAGGNTNFPGTPEVQVLTISHPTASQAVTGVFRLSFLGSGWSTYIPVTASATLVQYALEQLYTVGKVSVATITNANFPANMVAWAITFNTIVGNVPALTIDTTNLVPTTSVATLYDGNNAVLNNGAWCAAGDLVCAAIYSYVRIGEKAVGYGYFASVSPSILTYTISNLVPGTSYYTSVTTRNLLSLGIRGAAYPVSIIPPKQVPSPPTAVTVSVKYGISTQLLVSYSNPVSDGGDTIRKYLIEYDATPAFSSAGSQTVWCPTANVNAVWRITSSKVNAAQPLPISTGWFQLKLSRANAVWTTDPIPFNAVAMGASELSAQPAFSLVYCTTCTACTDTCTPARQQISGSMQKKLQGLLSIANGVTVTRTPTAATDGGYVWSVTFMDPGDDFALEAIASSTGLNCAGNACANSDYQVAAVKVTPGTNYATCTGSQTIPAVGALTKGQLYYIRVTAFNSVGFGLPQIAPNPQKPMVVPGIPTGVSLVVYSVSSLQVVFSPPLDNGGDTITSYTVTWSLNADFSASSSMVVTNLSGGSPFYAVISGLTKGLFYFVQVQATNSQGTGLPALSSPLSLNPSAVPSAPTNVVLGVTSPTMLTVGWAPPADNGGDPITGYIVEWDIIASYNSLTLAPDHSSVSISDPTQRSYTITLLTSQTAYYVHVFAVNSLGPGSPQDAAPLPGVPDLMPPGKPISLSASAVTTPNPGIYVQWQAPYVPYHGIPCFGTLANPSPCPLILGVSSVFGGSGLRTYFVEWDTSPVFTGTNRVSAAGNNILLTSATNGIVSGTTYYIRVQTVNNNGYMSLFCQRGNQAPYLCPDNLLLPDGSFVTGAYVTAIAP